jgi:hypothetical protein
LGSISFQVVSSLIIAPIVDTGGKFAAGIFDTGGKFATGINNSSETSGQNLPPVSLIPVVHLELRISPRIFEKI